MTIDLDKATELFAPFLAGEVERVKARGSRFVHYTSADSGLAILRSGQFLLRNSLLMNDFSEVQYGMSCLFPAYNDRPSGARLKALLSEVQPDLPDILQSNFNAQLLDCRTQTFLLSISEHGDPEHGDNLEDHYGRLSMWRAYAGADGVAFILNNRAFLANTDALKAYTFPVQYATVDLFGTRFDTMVEKLEQQKEALISMGGKFVHDALMASFRTSIQSTKHPAFREEREWRVIYTPTLLEPALLAQQNQRIPSSVMSLRGVPQHVYAIPFRNYPDEGLVGATVPELIDRVLIGPSANSFAIAHAFVSELEAMGVSDAMERVFVTDIPLRT